MLAHLQLAVDQSKLTWHSSLIQISVCCFPQKLGYSGLWEFIVDMWVRVEFSRMHDIQRAMQSMITAAWNQLIVLLNLALY